MMDKKIKILIVDDNNDIRDIYAEVFRKENFDVIEASDGLEGLEKANEKVPDIIFTGIIMPRMDGFSMMEALKKNVTTSKIPVAISSHMGREEDRKRAEELGAKDFIVRGETSPIQALERIKSLFINEGYNVEFNRNSLDSAKLAKELNTSQDFKCAKCNTDLVLRMQINNSKEGILNARLICPKCGWILKA